MSFPHGFSKKKKTEFEKLFDDAVTPPVSFTYGQPLDWGQPELVRGPGTHVLACKRYPVRKLMAYDANGNLDRDSPHNLLPLKFVDSFVENQQLASCCRHPENMDVEAWYSSENWMKGLDKDGNPLPNGQGKVPDIYIFKCNEVHPDTVRQAKDEDGNLLYDDYGLPLMETIPNPRPNGERWHVRFMVGGSNPVTGEKDIRPFWDVR